MESQRAAGSGQALVLGGGGAYGFVQAAYVEAALERGFQPSLLVGTSVGALNAAWVALNPGQTRGLVETWLGLGRRRILSLNPLRMASHVVRRRVSLCRNDIVGQLVGRYAEGIRLEETGIPLAVVATNLTRGEKHVFRSGPLGEAILASTAIPGVFEPVEIDGELYVDGSLTAQVDLATAAAMGAREILAIDLTPEPPAGRPRTALGVLRRSFGILARAPTAAMEECLAERLPIRVVRPDLRRESAWSLRMSEATAAANLEIARAALATVLDASGRVIPGRALRAGALAGTMAPNRGRVRPNLGRATL